MLENYTHTTLQNGLQVITVPMEVPSVTAMVLVKTGSRYETKLQSGISHFLEHMMFKGTKKRPSTMKIAQEIDGIGGEFNAFTGKEYTGYYIKSAVKHVSLLLDMLSDMTLNSLLKQEEITKEKGVIVQEIAMYEDTPLRKVGEVFEGLLYGDTPMGWDIAGTKDTVMSFTRDNFVSYMDIWYRPNNALVILAGGVPKDSSKLISGDISNYFGTWPKQNVGKESAVKENQTKPALKIIRKKTEQTHFCVGVRTFKRTDSRRYALSLLSIVLGGGMSSRLFSQVREKRGLAYYIKTAPEGFTDTGYVVTQAGVEFSKMEEALKIIVNEYNRVKSKAGKVTQKELSKAKEFAKGHLILGMEDSRGVADLFAESALLDNKIRTPWQILDAIDKVKVEDVLHVSEQIFKTSSLNLSAIGPFEEGEEVEKKFLKLLR